MGGVRWRPHVEKGVGGVSGVSFMRPLAALRLHPHAQPLPKAPPPSAITLGAALSLELGDRECPADTTQ